MDSPFSHLVPGETPTFTDLADAVTDLHERLNSLTVGDLPVKALQDKLEADWQPSASLLLGLGSVTPDMLARVPHVRVFNSVALSIPHNAVTGLTFNSELYDSTGTMHSTAANTGRLVAPIAGLYEIGAAGEWGLSAAGNLRQVEIRSSSGGRISIDRTGPTPGVAGPCNNPATQWRMSAGDWVDFAVYQDSGAALNFGVGGPVPLAWMVWKSA